MSLKATLKQIVELQNKHKEMSQRQRDREALYLDVAEERGRLNALKTRREELRKNRQENQKAADSLEVKTQESEAEIAKLEAQLNVTKHQKEYDAIRQSIASHKADILKMEDDELSRLQHTDSLQREGAALDTEIALEQEKLQKLEADVAQKADAYDIEIRALKRDSNEMEKSIDPKVLSTFKRMMGGRSDTVLVVVKNRTCQGCFTSITKQMLNELQWDREICYCPSCGRILTLADEENEF